MDIIVTRSRVLMFFLGGLVLILLAIFGMSRQQELPVFPGKGSAARTDSREADASVNPGAVDASSVAESISKLTNNERVSITAESNTALKQSAGRGSEILGSESANATPQPILAVPASYSTNEAGKYFVSKENRKRGNLGGPPPLLNTNSPPERN